MLISEGLLRKLPTSDTDVYDTRTRGLVLRCRASGRHTYRLQVRRGRWLTIGPIDDFSPRQARAEAERLRGDIARGKDPEAERRLLRAATFKQYLANDYGPWVIAHRRTGDETLRRLRQAFAEFLPLSMGDISQARVERWRTARLAAQTAPATVNRDLAALRAALSHAVEIDLLPAHPLARLKAARLDNGRVVRYLSGDEEVRLREALSARDTRRRQAREAANLWRRERSYDELPPYRGYTDHLTPLTLLALNTGCRRGELFGLTWADVEGGAVTIHGTSSKSGQTRHIPMNREARQIIRTWRPVDAKPGAHVFANGGKEGLTTIKTAWAPLLKRASIEAFRFHDLRHTFASNLVMAGVDLNTVRELLGHADLKMTLRYAHLAPAIKAAAVEKLGRAEDQSSSPQ
jgi:integrase